MAWEVAKSYPETLQLLCGCGAELSVRYTMQKGMNKKETFHCPKCGKRHALMASLPIGEADVSITKD